MLARLATFALATLALACGGDGPTPPPIEVPRGAVVQLKSNDVLVFAGQRVSLRNLVWRVTDSAGRPITSYTLAAQLPAGWTFRNDTVIAPATEAVARLRVTATYLPSANGMSQYAAPLFNEAPADTTDTATVTAAVDLKSRKWRVSFTCADSGGGSGVMTDDGTRIDSMRVNEATVDSIRYASDSGWVSQFGGTAQVWMTGPMIRWLRNGTVDTVTYTNHHEIHRQAPDTLELGLPGDPKQLRRALRVSPGTIDDLLRYEGGTFCSGPMVWRHRRGPVAMQEVAP